MAPERIDRCSPFARRPGVRRTPDPARQRGRAQLRSAHAAVALPPLRNPAGGVVPLLGLSPLDHLVLDMPPFPPGCGRRPRPVRAGSPTHRAPGGRDARLLGGPGADRRPTAAIRRAGRCSRSNVRSRRRALARARPLERGARLVVVGRRRGLTRARAGRAKPADQGQVGGFVSTTARLTSVPSGAVESATGSCVATYVVSGAPGGSTAPTVSLSVSICAFASPSVMHT